MSFEAGQRLGAYEILSPLGAGGMGEVYRARDTRLHRGVAIKVLPADRLGDDARRRRFVQEARAASALNHPNIVTIHEIESANGADFIVMEYVPGQTLAALLRSRLPLVEALRVAIQIADALASAHAAGIVHRDLKPANVVVTPEGLVKVLDFGLAKLVASEDESDEVETRSEESSSGIATGPGIVAGTPGYMSPEQAAGGKVDARSDIFAFGSLLYEMATGRRAFAGASRAETLGAVLQARPQPPREIDPALPVDLEKLIARCLRKEPEKRFQHMADVKVALQELKDEQEASAGARAGGTSARRRTLWLAGVAALAVMAVVGVLMAGRLRPETPAAPRVVPLTATSGYEGWPTFSPDGNQIAFQWNGEVTERANVFSGNWDIWLKLIGSAETRRLTTDPALDWCPSWSPDGRQIAFVRSAPAVVSGAPASYRLHLVSAIGGAERKVSDFATAAAPPAWSADGRWLVAGTDRAPGDTSPGAGALHLISLETGEAVPITTPEAPGHDSYPALSPDQTRLAYVSCRFWRLPPCDVQVVGVGLDLVPKGPPRRLARLNTRVWSVAFSRDGKSVLYSEVPNTYSNSRLWRADVTGARPPERLELAPRGAVSVAVSPAQDRLAFTLDDSGYSNVFRFEPDRAPKAVLASPGGDNSPSFSPDGRRIAFMSLRAGEGSEIWLTDPDGSNPVQLTHGPGTHQGTPRFSPDGKRIVFESRGADGFADLWTVEATGGRPRRLTESTFHAGRASWSRDGRFLFHREDRADGSDIVRTPEAGGPPVRVTRTGGFFARPSADGRWLYYAKTEVTSPLFRMAVPDGPEQQVVDCMQSVSLEAGPDGMYYAGCGPPGSEAELYRLDVASGRRQLLGRLPPERSVLSALAVSPDGKTILFASLMPRRADLMLIENFR